MARAVDLQIPITASGVRPDKLALSEPALAWETASVGARGASRALRVRSVGVETASTKFVLTGADKDQFDVTGCPLALAPGAECELTVTPKPTRVGALAARIEFERAACDLGVGEARDERRVVAELEEVPTHDALRAVSYGGAATYIAGDGGIVLRGAPGQPWTVVPTGVKDDVALLGRFGGERYDVGIRQYDYRADERELVFAAGRSGSVLVSRGGAPFVALAPSLEARLVGLEVGSVVDADGATPTIVRPSVTLLTATGESWTSQRLEPLHRALLRVPVTPLRAQATCRVGTASFRVYIGDDGIAHTFKPAVGSGSRPQSTDVPRADEGAWLAVACDDTAAVVVGEYGALMTSKDGVDWKNLSTSTTATLRATVHDHGRQIAVGDRGTVMLADDGGAFRAVESGTSEDLYAVQPAESGFLAVGAHGTVVRIRVR